MVTVASPAVPRTRPASPWASTAEFAAGDPGVESRSGLALAAGSRLRIRIGGEVQHLARMFARLARDLEPAQHAGQFLGALVHREFGDRGACGLAFRELRDAQMMVALAGDL